MQGDLMLKKRGFIFVLLLFLLSVSVFAQDFGFDFQFGRRSGTGYGGGYGAGSSISNAISSALDTIFGGILGPFFDAIRFNFYSAVKLALIIVLYLVFSTVFKNFFGSRGMHPKFAKVIAAILALFSVVFIPESLLDLVFRDLLSGFVGYLLLAAVVVLPLYLIFKWSRDNKEDRAVNLVSAFLFFALIIVFSELHNQFIYALNYGLVQTLSSLTITFGVIFALVLFVHRLYLGFKGEEGGEREHSRERSREESRDENREERDEFEREKSSAQRLISIANDLRQNIHHISDVPETLARELLTNANRLNFVNISAIHNLHNGVTRLSESLHEAKKDRQKAREVAAQIIDRYNGLHDSLDSFSQLRRRLTHYLMILRSTLSATPPGTPDYNYFGDLIGRLRMIDRNLRELVTALSRVERL